MEPRQLPPLVAQGLAKSKEIADATRIWHEENLRQVERIRQKVAQGLSKFGAWVEAHGPEIAAVLETLIELDQTAKRIEFEWRQAGLGYLVAPMSGVEKIALLLHASSNESMEILDFVESSLADDEFVSEAVVLLNKAEVLSDVSRDHLAHGLDHLRQREFMNAWPPLIIGLEGAFADVAVASRIAVRDGNHVYLLAEDGSRLERRSPSIEGVARRLGHSADESDFGEFLVRQVYGGEGNPFRHGTAREGVRERSIALAIAVVGWIDVFVAPGSRDLLRKALARELARHQASDMAHLEGKSSASIVGDRGLTQA